MATAVDTSAHLTRSTLMTVSTGCDQSNGTNIRLSAAEKCTAPAVSEQKMHFACSEWAENALRLQWVRWKCTPPAVSELKMHCACSERAGNALRLKVSVLEIHCACSECAGNALRMQWVSWSHCQQKKCKYLGQWLPAALNDAFKCLFAPNKYTTTLLTIVWNNSNVSQYEQLIKKVNCRSLI